MPNNTYKVISHNGRELTSADYPLHPGYIVGMEIDARGLKKQDVAKELNLQPANLSELLKEKRNVSAMLALRLEKLFGVDADFWLRVQSSYDLAKARRKMAEMA